MKKSVVLLVLMFFLIAAASTAFSSDGITVYIDNTLIDFEDTPFIQEGRTLVPMRGFFESLEAEVTWEADTRTAVGRRGDITVRIPIGSTEPTVNEEVVPIDVAAQIINGRTYIPLRFVGEALGDEVSWDGETSTISITRGVGTKEPVEEPFDSPGDFEDFVEEQVVLKVDLYVSNHLENHFKAGDPPVSAWNSLEISFQESGVWTFARVKEQFGGGYYAFPGVLPDYQDPVTSNLHISAIHTCRDQQGFILGRETRKLYGKILPGSGGFDLSCEGYGKVAINLMPTRIDIDVVECDIEHCIEGFSRSSVTIGENPEKTIEDEHGYQIVRGFDIAVVDWETLKAVAEGGEFPLSIPFDIDQEQRHEYEDPPGYPAHSIETYKVSGGIGYVDLMPLEPIPN